MDAYEHDAVSDETLEKEIEDALGVDPSPEFLPRVRARIADERLSAGWASSGLWRWASAGVAVAAVVIIALSVANGPSPAPREAHVVSAPPNPGSGIRESGLGIRTSNTDSSATAAVRGHAVQKPRVLPARGAAPLEVVISSDDTVALRKLVVAIAARQVKAVDVPALGAEAVPLPRIEEIVPLEELVLEPIKLSPMAGLEGE